MESASSSKMLAIIHSSMWHSISEDITLMHQTDDDDVCVFWGREIEIFPSLFGIVSLNFTSKYWELRSVVCIMQK
jgi:hypothetical protein